MGTFGCVFLLISGFVISGRIYNSEECNYAKVMIKRYLKLSFPIFILSIFVYFLLKGNCLFHPEINKITGSIWAATHYNNAASISIRDVFVTSFYKVEFIGDNTFSTAFWMLSYLFFGYYVSILLAIVSKGKCKRIIVVFGVLVLIFWYQQSYLIMSALGTWIAYYYKYYNKIFSPQKWGIVLFICGIFFAGYPTGVIPDNVYAYMQLGYFSMHVIGAVLIFMGLMKSTVLRRRLESRICMFLGRISFAVYLVHIPILFSISHYLFMELFIHREIGYQVSTMITLIVSIAIVILIAYIFYVYIEALCDKFANWILKQICKNRQG